MRRPTFILDRVVLWTIVVVLEVFLSGTLAKIDEEAARFLWVVLMGGVIGAALLVDELIRRRRRAAASFGVIVGAGIVWGAMVLLALYAGRPPGDLDHALDAAIEKVRAGVQASEDQPVTMVPPNTGLDPDKQKPLAEPRSSPQSGLGPDELRAIGEKGVAKYKEDDRRWPDLLPALIAVSASTADTQAGARLSNAVAGPYSDDDVVMGMFRTLVSLGAFCDSTGRRTDVCEDSTVPVYGELAEDLGASFVGAPLLIESTKEMIADAQREGDDAAQYEANLHQEEANLARGRTLLVLMREHETAIRNTGNVIRARRFGLVRAAIESRTRVAQQSGEIRHAGFNGKHPIEVPAALLKRYGQVRDLSLDGFTQWVEQATTVAGTPIFSRVEIIDGEGLYLWADNSAVIFPNVRRFAEYADAFVVWCECDSGTQVGLDFSFAKGPKIPQLVFRWNPKSQQSEMAR